MAKSLAVGILFGLSGGFAGALLFTYMLRSGWLDGPGGGMAVFPLVLLPAVGFGAYGFLGTVRTTQRARTDSN